MLNAGSVPIEGHRSCERSDEEEHLKCLFLFPLIPLYPCYLFLLPDLLYSKHLFLSVLFPGIAFVFCLSVSCHFSLSLCLSPHSQFPILLFGLVFFLGAGMPQPSLHCLPLHLIKWTGRESIQLLFSLRWWGFYGFLKVVARKNLHHHHNFISALRYSKTIQCAESGQSDFLKAAF